jgi:hypothetical protein
MTTILKIKTKASLLVFSSALVFACTPDPNDPGK